MEKHILITGMPGVGKTTLIKNIVKKLELENIKCRGFFTEELRDNYKNRSGFDIVSLNNDRQKLARIINHNQQCAFSVGKYEVFVKEFESFALPLIANQTCDMLILDEIGKMELFSKQFQLQVDRLFKENKQIIIATIPVAKNKGIHFVEKLRNNPMCKTYTVDRNNRDSLLNDIINKLHSIKNK